MYFPGITTRYSLLRQPAQMPGRVGDNLPVECRLESASLKAVGADVDTEVRLTEMRASRRRKWFDYLGLVDKA